MKILTLLLTAITVASYAGTASSQAEKAGQSIKNAGSKATEAAIDTKNAIVHGSVAAKNAIANKASAAKSAIAFTNNVAKFLNKIREDEKRTGLVSSSLATANFPDAIHPEQLVDAKEIILSTWPATRAALKFSRIEHDGATIKFIDGQTLGVDLTTNTIYIQYDSTKPSHTNRVGLGIASIKINIK